MVEELSTIEKIKICINEEKNFVLQGGAGSGKTETLKDVVEYVSINYPQKKLACITHTNLAADEISERIGNTNHSISTIHSFLNSHIKNFKKNMHEVIYELFKAPLVVRISKEENVSEADYKKNEHSKYKKCYGKYSKLKFTLTGKSSDKVMGKKMYDSDPGKYNSELNSLVDALNLFLKSTINEKDYTKIKYNETIFNSLKDLTFGHDGLIKMFYLLIQKFPQLIRIIQNKYDIILVDEYQDTNDLIVKATLDQICRGPGTIVGFFGDSMQSIYEDGVGDVEEYVTATTLVKIEKEDNFRCSTQVIELINKVRNDGLIQNVALARKKDGTIETETEREGSVKLFFSRCDSKPNAFSNEQDKDSYQEKIDTLLERAFTDLPNAKVLMLTNKSISNRVGFEFLYKTYSEYFIDPVEPIEKDMKRLQLLELCKICEDYEKQNYNNIYSSLKKLGLSINSINDKMVLKEKFDMLLTGDLSAVGAIEYSFKNNLIKMSESFQSFDQRRTEFLKHMDTDKEMAKFRLLIKDGNNTFVKIKKVQPNFDEETYKEFDRDIKRESFYKKIYSDDLKFKEVLTFFRYREEKTKYITMHKTKGSSIGDVIVVLDEFFWNDYNFETLFLPGSDGNENRINKTLKLFYVACSRAKKNLYCVKLVKPNEVEKLENFFTDIIEVPVE